MAVPSRSSVEVGIVVEADATSGVLSSLLLLLLLLWLLVSLPVLVVTGVDTGNGVLSSLLLRVLLLVLLIDSLDTSGVLLLLLLLLLLPLLLLLLLLLKLLLLSSLPLLLVGVILVEIGFFGRAALSMRFGETARALQPPLCLPASLLSVCFTQCFSRKRTLLLLV